MRVLHVETGRHLTGGGAQVRYLLGGLHAARIDNVLVCAAGGELAEHAGSATEIVALPARGDLDPSFALRLARVIRARRPDLIHVHSRRGADLYGGVAAALTGVPAVLTRRVDSREIGAWARLKYRPYARLIAISRAIEAQLSGCGVAAERIVRIPSAVDASRFRPDAAAHARLRAAFGLPADALVVAVVAQLIARKGHRDLIAALPEVLRREPRVRVLCFGRGPLAAALRADVAARGLDEHVRFAGFRSDLPSLLPGVDVLVHPAEREGLGVALLEAASCSVPVVAAAAGGVIDVVEHGRTGLLYPANDYAALATALAALLGDPAQRRRLGADARAAVQRRFGVDAMVGAYLDLYGAVASRERSRAPALGSRARSSP